MNLQESIRRDLTLMEDRRTDLDYKEKSVKGEVDRVTVEVSGNESGGLTRIGKRYVKIGQAIDKLNAQRKKINEEQTDGLLEYFDAEDEVLTRVVDTVSATFTLSKKTTKTKAPTFDRNKMLQNLPDDLIEQLDYISEDMLPGLVKALELITKKYTTVYEAVEVKPSLRITPRKTKPPVKVKIESIDPELADDGLDHRVLTALRDFIDEYDQKLNQLNTNI
jgi:hypothetical protein